MAHGLSPLIKREIECNSTKPRNSTEANHTNHTNSATVTPNTKMGSRRIFTPQFKLQVLDSYRNDSDCKGNQRATARKYGIHRRQIQKWLQCESNLRSSVLNSGINNGGKNNCNNNNNNNNNNINNNNIINNTINNPTTPTSHSTEVASVVSLDTTRHSVALSGHNCNNSTTGSMGFVSPVHSHVSDNVSVSFAHESSASLPNSPVPTLTNQKHELNVVVCDISPISAGGVGGGGVYDFATIKQEQQFYDNYYMAAPLTSYNHNYDYQQQNPHHHHHHHHDHHNMQQQDHQHCPPENHEMSLSNYDYSDVMEATEAPIDLSLHHRRRNEAIPRVPSESQQIISTHNCSNNCSNNNNISLNDEQPHLTDLSSSPPIDLSCRKRKLSSNVSADPGIKINTSCGGSGNVSADGGGSPSKVIKLFKPYLDHAEDDINDEIEVKKKPHDTHDPIIWSNHPCSPELYENHNIYSYEYNFYPSPTYPAASAFYDYGSNYWCHRRGSPVSSSTGAYDRAASISSSYSTNSESSDLTTCTSYRQQRHYYSIDFKLQAIDSYYHDSTCRGNQRAVASKYNIHRRQIQKWLQQEEDLRQRPTMVR